MRGRNPFRNTRIVCTIGPASNSREVIERLVRGGMDVARLNFSHGDHAAHGRAFALIREAARKYDRPVAVLQDLQGIRIRTGTFEGGSATLRKGAEVAVIPGTGRGSAERIYISFAGIAERALPGDRILINDGIVELKVLGRKRGVLRARVVEGGDIADRKGVNLPGMKLTAPALTAKDRKDLLFGLGLGVDYVAISFVREAADVRKVRDFIRRRGPGLPLIAKIEKPEAVENIEAILDEAEGIMVARGDLGVEMPPEEVPLIQKMLIERANRRGRLVITATQMLESMTGHSTPTRAEATDVANAVLDGSDALMLSAETSMGKYPVPALRMMDRIARRTESSIQAEPSYLTGGTYSEAVADAAARAAEDVGAKFVVAFTQSGYTARLLSKYRPSVPIIAFTPHEHVRRRMSLYRGVMSRLMKPLRSTDEVFSEVEKTLLKEKLIRPGESVVITASAPVGGAGKTNLMKLHRAGG